MKAHDIVLFALLGAVFAAAGHAAAAEPSGQGFVRESDLDKLLAPVNEGRDRQKFLRAAGTDTELDEQEFLRQAEDNAADGFVQPHDRWSNLLRYDKNRNKKIDWLEARNYREGVRFVLLARFDGNQDERLADIETTAAVQALNEGTLFDQDCCGGKRVDPRQYLTSVTPSAEELLAYRRNIAAAYKVGDRSPRRPAWMIDQESQLMPFTDIALEDVRSALDDPRLDELVGEDKPMLEALLYHDLKWLLTSDAEAFKEKMNDGARYATGQAMPDDYPFEEMRRFELLAGNSLNRIGFAHEPVSVEHDRAIKYLPEQHHPLLPRELRKQCEQEMPIIKVNMAARLTPVLPLRIAPESAGALPEIYTRTTMIVLYDRTRKANPFMILHKDVQPMAQPDVQVAGLVRGTSN